MSRNKSQHSRLMQFLAKSSIARMKTDSMLSCDDDFCVLLTAVTEAQSVPVSARIGNDVVVPDCVDRQTLPMV